MRNTVKDIGVSEGTLPYRKKHNNNLIKLPIEQLLVDHLLKNKHELAKRLDLKAK